MIRRFTLSTAILLMATILTAQATIRYVKSNGTGTGTDSWNNASNDLQAMINNSSAGDEVWVAAGTYKPTRDPVSGSTTPTDNRDKVFYMKDGVKLYGGFAGTETNINERNFNTNRTVLSGDLDNDNTLEGNSYHVIISVVAKDGTGVIIDGFTITGGNASLNNNMSINSMSLARHWGGGIALLHGSNTISNNRIYGNYSLNYGGGISTNDGTGADASGGTNKITNNWIYDNSADNSGGGVRMYFGNHEVENNFIYNNQTKKSGGGVVVNPTTGQSSIINNNVFYDNTAAEYGGGVFSAAGDKATISNNTFYTNTATLNGGGLCNSSNSVDVNNNIFRNNKKGTDAASAGADYGYNVEGTSKTRVFKNNMLQLASLVSYSATGAGGNSITTSTSNIFAIDPKFFDSNSPLGADELPYTADDGLRVTCNSTALTGGATGTGIPTMDIAGTIRGASSVTIGAYEKISVNTALPGDQKNLSLTQSGLTTYGVCDEYLIATLASTGANPVSGTVEAKVWVESTQPSNYVRRHYELTPASNASTFTGRVTLYFTQADFDAFNSVSSLDLPTGSSDATGKANLKIEKRSGSSTTGLPTSYTGAISTIDPADTDIVWNGTLSRWEVSFDVTSFSGFFIKTNDASLPLNLISFKAAKHEGFTLLQWATTNEINTRDFEIQKSSDAKIFHKLTNIEAKKMGDHNYSYVDASVYYGDVFYRLKMNDSDGTYAYSKIISLSNYATITTLYPNPATELVTVSVANSLLKSSLVVHDLTGREVQTSVITSNPHQITIGSFAKGVYILKFADGTAVRFVKE